MTGRDELLFAKKPVEKPDNVSLTKSITDDSIVDVTGVWEKKDQKYGTEIRFSFSDAIGTKVIIRFGRGGGDYAELTEEEVLTLMHFLENSLKPIQYKTDSEYDMVIACTKCGNTIKQNVKYYKEKRADGWWCMCVDCAPMPVRKLLFVEKIAEK